MIYLKNHYNWNLKNTKKKTEGYNLFTIKNFNELIIQYISHNSDKLWTKTLSNNNNFKKIITSLGKSTKLKIQSPNVEFIKNKNTVK